MTEDPQVPVLPKWLIYSLAILGMVTLIGLAFYTVQFFGMWPKNPEHYAWFGDYFGGFAGTLFSAATVFLLVWSLILQRKELTDTRQVLAETQAENARASDAHEAHIKYLHNQIQREDIYRLITESRTNLLKLLERPIPDNKSIFSNLAEESLIYLVNNPTRDRALTKNSIQRALNYKDADLTWYLLDVMTSCHTYLSFLNAYTQIVKESPIAKYHSHLPIKTISVLCSLGIQIPDDIIQTLKTFNFEPKILDNAVDITIA
ncbi:hypothetical protein [Agarivorans gilvus]|uniref:Phage abortive infection protein n=1 Tax=Agarivorans gilvus TaxID=680279 RepID=A0ABQ1HXB1_9ALTE|nr:hypothetical protein [Agarivorans gilvus]GGA95808.1 hypothetical protein GCM10007414_05800 [Agarivorans gilvus]